MGFVEDQQQRAFGLPGLVQDLLEEAILAASRDFSQLGHQQFQQACRGQVSQVQVDRFMLRPRQVVHESFDQGRLAHAAGAGDQPHGGLVGQIMEASQSLPHAIVLPEGLGGDALGEWLRRELEVGEEHQGLLSSWSFCNRNKISGMVRCEARAQARSNKSGSNRGSRV